jgi:hypothetical protein
MHLTILSRNLNVRALALICSVISSFAVHAQNATTKPLSGQYAEVNKQLQVWNDRPSTDDSPIAFSIGNVQYRVPRNYIVWMDNWNGGPQTLVRFKVTYPKFEPLNDKNTPCMSLAPLYRPPGCVPFEFWITDGESLPTDEQQFNNTRDLFHSQTPLLGPYGFELYEMGPENARINTYRKQTSEHVLIIQCFLRKPEGDVKHNPVCTNHSRIVNGNELAYRLYGDELKDAEQIDEGFRVLINSFVSEGNER